MAFERYRYQEFAWWPTHTIEKAFEFLEMGATALHMKSAFNSAEQLEKLLNAVSNARIVRALFISDNSLGDDSCEVLKNFLSTDRMLKYLFLEHNSFTVVGAASLVEGLKQNRTLRSLFVGQNSLTNQSARAFAEYLQTNHTLYELGFGKLIDDLGALYLAKGLSFNNTLRSLYLLSNNIEDKGARVLAEVVSRHPSCDVVEVVSNTINLEKFQGMIKNMTEKELKAAFESAVLNNEKGPWLRSKIMVVGQGRAGKTATVRSLLGLTFDPALDSTVGASISQSHTRNSNNEWRQEKSGDVKIDFTTDTASRIAALKIARRRNDDAKLFADFDIDSFVKQYAKHQAERDAEVKEMEAREAAMKAAMAERGQREETTEKFNAQLITNKNAQKDDIAFTIWDYGGQQVFYTLHHLFLTRYGIYLLAFDMRDVVCKGTTAGEKKLKQAETKDYLQFWLNSVNMHAEEAPLIVIGTFLDAVNTELDLLEVNAFVQELVQKFPQVVPNGKMAFFPLNNVAPADDISGLMSPLGGKSGRNIEILRDTIEDVARNESFVTQEVSLRWMKILDQTLSNPNSHVSYKEVEETAKRVGVETTKELDEMLEFFHELGVLVHLTSTANLKNIVTTKPQWLIDSLSKVIRDEELHKQDEGAIKTAGLVKDHQLLLQKSIITHDWLEFLWPKESVDFLVDLMRRTMLISDWKFGEFVNENAYLVPSLIKMDSIENKQLAEKYLKSFQLQVEGQKLSVYLNTANVGSIVFDFNKSYLPNGVFQRLLCLVVFHCSRDSNTNKLKEPELYKNSATVYFADGQEFKLFKHENQVMCMVKKDHSRAFKMLQSMMRKLKVDVMGEKLNYDIYFEVCDGTKQKDGQILHNFIEYEEAKKLKASPWFSDGTTLVEEKKEEKGVDLESFLENLAVI